MMKASTRTILACAAVAITILALWHTNRLVEPKKATKAEVRAEAGKHGYGLINTEELWEKLRKDPKNILLVDTRQEWEYRTGHIKGAVNFPMEPTAWSRWRKQGAVEQLLGPDKNRFIVFY